MTCAAQRLRRALESFGFCRAFAAAVLMHPAFLVAACNALVLVCRRASGFVGAAVAADILFVARRARVAIRHVVVAVFAAVLVDGTRASACSVLVGSARFACAFTAIPFTLSRVAEEHRPFVARRLDVASKTVAVAGEVVSNAFACSVF